MVTKQHYSIQESSGSVLVTCPDGSTEIFSDINTASEWIRLDIILRNGGTNGTVPPSGKSY